jgi:hypothetical protein
LPETVDEFFVELVCEVILGAEEDNASLRD